MRSQPPVARRTRERGVVTLWDLLGLMSFSSGFGGAIAAATDGHAPLSVWRALLVVILAPPVGAACAWLHWRVGGYLAENVKSGATLRLIYLGAVVWSLVAAVLAFQITQWAIRLAAI